MRNKRTRRLILLSLIVFIFLYKSSFIAENFKFKYSTYGEAGHQVITSLRDNYTPLIANPTRKSPVHRNNTIPFGFVAYSSFIYIEMLITACLLLTGIIRDVRKIIMELIPAHFYGSKYDLGAIFS